MIDFGSSEFTWFIIGLIIMLAELLLPGFILIFFGIGAWVTALGIALGLLPGFSGQLIVFLLSSVASLVLFRKKGKNYFQGKVSGKLGKYQSLDDIKGQRVVVVNPIRPKNVDGKVEYNGTFWTATADVELPKGAVVEIVERDNLTLHVKPIS
jgi:membrane protein implicated in regulation of membrane protease activity